MSNLKSNTEAESSRVPPPTFGAPVTVVPERGKAVITDVRAMGSSRSDSAFDNDLDRPRTSLHFVVTYTHGTATRCIPFVYDARLGFAHQMKRLVERDVELRRYTHDPLENISLPLEFDL